MKVLFSDEGPSDLGACTNSQGECAGADFRCGPMAVLVAQLAEPVLNYDLLGFPESFHFVSETALRVRTKALPDRLQPARGKKKGVETHYFYANARVLGALAQTLTTTSKEPVLAVLFRDGDGTHSSAHSLWGDKVKSMHDGFSHSEFGYGVPMMPRPKSEAWLLCGALPHSPSYAALENLPGNDASPNSAKNQLDAAWGGHKTADELCDWLVQNPLDTARADTLPSFKAFRETLVNALTRLARLRH